jgi:Bifunctional DNA primase/polymerase, N-terminal
MGTFKDIAEPLAKMGVPMTPVRPGTKRAFLPDFPTTATTDQTLIETWDKLYPNHNGACVARAEDGGVWFWEVDSPDVIPRMERETGLTAPATFKVRSRPGRGHFYFRHTAASIAMGNISQTYVVGQDWSVRTNREYVVGPGSIHPDTQQPYLAMSWATPIMEAPDWLVRWLLSQKIQKQAAFNPDAPTADFQRNAANKVPHGSIHGFMLTHAGRMRAAGLTQEEIEVALLRIVNEQCEHPIDESKVVQMSRSICNFPPGTTVSSIALTQTASQPAANEESEDAPQFEIIEYPLFPRHVMFGTSIYEGFVKPYCENSSRIDYFMWIPTAVMMMNYIGTKVTVPFSSWKSSFYVVLIGKKAATHKTSSIKDAMKFLEYGGMLAHYSKNVKNADTKSLVWQAGSPEGLGTDMMRTNCKNAILSYGELSTLVGKAGIEGSGMNSALLDLYESDNFSNSIKSKKDTFSIDPGSYVATLITATTDKKFAELWSQLAGEDTGLNDRFTWVLEPRALPEKKLEYAIGFNEAALATRHVVDIAVQKGKYEFFDKTPLQRILMVYGPRQAARAEKWALYFAIDLQLDEIDEDCVARGIEMVKYEEAVKDYLLTFEAKNDESAIQQGVVRLLKKNGGLMEKRDIMRTLNANKYGGTNWDRAYNWLVNSGHIVQYGKGIKGDPCMVKLLRDMSFGRDDD